MTTRPIRRALISVYHKEGIDRIARILHAAEVEIVSTGGTQEYIESLGIPCTPVEALTALPSILGGRVKTLHPMIFGGILARRDNEHDEEQVAQYALPLIDLVIVDLYPFAETVASGASEEEIIEKIDIGGISLIRAAAKNYHDVLICSHRDQYDALIELLERDGCSTTLPERRSYALRAFEVTASYDSGIFNYFDEGAHTALHISGRNPRVLRYGENPHQMGFYYGDLDHYFDKLQGKELSYNNLQDLDAAVHLIQEFEAPTFAVLKHTNPCGIASRETISEAWQAAYEADTESAFGGILVANRAIDKETAEQISHIFFEVLIAPDFDTEALQILGQKSKRILLLQKAPLPDLDSIRTAAGGYLVQTPDVLSEPVVYTSVTEATPTEDEMADIRMAESIVKYCKSNALAIVRDSQLLATGIGQTSRVSALRQAIQKAHTFGFDLKGAVLASDAFFPFRDCVDLAAAAGITAIVQPGGSIRDQESIDACNEQGVAMVTTGVRHFRH